MSSDGAGGDQFGFPVPLSGDTAVVGAIGGDDKGTRSGSAYVFVAQPSVAVEPRVVDFGTAVADSHSPARTLTVTSRGLVAATVSDVSFGGAHPGDFTVKDNACRLPVGVLGVAVPWSWGRGRVAASKSSSALPPSVGTKPP